jgi:hypothetical protein
MPPSAAATPVAQAETATVVDTAKAASPVVQTTSTTNAKSTGDAKPQSPDFLIMYTGDVVMSVDEVATTLDHIADLAESFGGHLAGRRDQGISVRIPSPRFREALGKVAALGDLTHESVIAEDVSEEFHDAEVRLANLKATQKRLQDFLAKSGNIADMLTLEHELERVAMDIDRIEGRMRFLREHVAFSTLTVTLVARPKSQPVVAGGGKPTTTSSPRIMHLDAAWLDDMGVPKLMGGG